MGIFSNNYPPAYHCINQAELGTLPFLAFGNDHGMYAEILPKYQRQALLWWWWYLVLWKFGMLWMWCRVVESQNQSVNNLFPDSTSHPPTIQSRDFLVKNNQTLDGGASEGQRGEPENWHSVSHQRALPVQKYRHWEKAKYVKESGFQYVVIQHFPKHFIFTFWWSENWVA